MKIISRIAPTPSGYLHLGNIYNFILTSSLVGKSGGTLWLRIDDCDRGRVKREYIEDIFVTLKWLGIHWDKGPQDVNDFEKNYSQVEKKSYYFNRLREFDTYTCNCSRQDIKNRGVEQGYDSFCKNIQLDFKAGDSAIRFCSKNDDFVLWTKDNNPGYQLVSVIDDLDCGVNLIVRGDDLRETTSMQQELASALGKQLPEVQFHKLMVDSVGAKLSKSNMSHSIKSMREAGMTAKEVLKLAKNFGRKDI